MLNENMKIRYPFHGFYRKFLLDEGYAEDGPTQQPDQDRTAIMRHTVLPTIEAEKPPAQQIEAVGQISDALVPADTDLVSSPVTEAKPCAAVQENAQKDPQWIADLIGDDFKTWGPGLVAIEASTGTGKTSLVLNQMLDWTEEQACKELPVKRTLVLCNRVPLKVDILRKLDIKKQPTFEPDGFGGWTCMIDDFELIHIQTYQYYEKWLRHDLKGVKRDLNNYRYIVCDEAHYFVDDATFNQDTTLMYDTLLEFSKNVTVIFMTATPGVMFESWRKQGRLAQNRHYSLRKKSNWITKAVVYQKDQLKAILDAIPAGEKAVVFVKSIDRLEEIKSWYGDEAGCYCSENNAQGKRFDNLKACIDDGKLQRRIVAATQVLYNGIDIIDPTVKHVIIEDYEPIKVIQELGRKRPQGESDTCTAYFREFTPKERGKYAGWIKRNFEVTKACWKRANGNVQAWNELLNKNDANKQISDAISKGYISHDHVTRKYSMSRLCLENLKEKNGQLQKIRDVGYWQFMQMEVWGVVLNVEPQKYMSQALTDYIKNNMGHRLCKDDMQNGLVDAGLCTKVQSIKKLNVLLEPFGVEIVSGTEWGRKSASYGKVVYWLQEQRCELPRFSAL